MGILLNIILWSTLSWIQAQLIGDIIQSSGILESNNDEREKDPCYNFTVGDPRHHEFTSPNYPNDYPPNTECIREIRGLFYFFLIFHQTIFNLNRNTNDAERCTLDRTYAQAHG